MKYKMFATIMCLLLVLCSGCSKNSSEKQKSDEVEKQIVSIDDRNYIQILRDEILSNLVKDDQSDYEKTKTIYKYVAESSNWEDPIATDIWIIRGGLNQSETSYLERKSISILQFGYGYCDDYAAAVSVLLTGAGIENRYIPGLAYDGTGRLVDHAWNLVKIDNQWYHLDATFEDSYSKQGVINYRYFLKGNNDMSATHIWGDNLLNNHYLTDLQNDIIRKFYDVEVSNVSYTQPSSEEFIEKSRRNKEAIIHETETERDIFIEEHGRIAPYLYDATAPVFGDMGFNRN